MILKIFILLILFLFPFGEILRLEMGNNIVIKPLDVVVGLAAIWWVVSQIQSLKFKVQNYNSKFKSLRKSYFLFPLLLFVSIGLYSLLINLSWLKSQEFFVSFLYLVRWVSYALLFPIVLQFDKTFKKKITVFLFIDGLIILAFGYLQYFFYNSLKNLYYLGWDEHMHRIFSTFFDPNFAGAFFVLYLLFVGGLILKNISKRHSGKRGTSASGIRFITAVRDSGQARMTILSIVLLLTLLAIFLTFSRSALLTLIVGAVTFFILINKKKLLLLLFGTIILFGLIASPKFYDENMNLFRETSSKARLANYDVALRVIQDHPIVGVGFNSYRYTKPLYGLDHDWVDAPSHADAGVDNSYLFVLATTGIVGFVAYGWLWIHFLKNAFSLHKKKFKIGAVIVISSSFALFTNAFFINSLFFAPLMLWMWIIIALLDDAELR